MQRICVFAGLTAILTAGVLLAQSDSDYQAWMKSNAANMGSMNKNIAAKEGAAAAADAKKIEDTFKQVGDFWKKRGGADDAVNFAAKGQAAAAAVAAAASAGNMDEAAAQVKNLQATCGGCHMAHREGAPGSFKIK